MYNLATIQLNSFNIKFLTSALDPRRLAASTLQSLLSISVELTIFEDFAVYAKRCCDFALCQSETLFRILVYQAPE